MRKFAALMLGVCALALCSCAPPREWVKQGVTLKERNADHATCLNMAQREAQNLAWDHQIGPGWPYYPYAYQGFYGYYGYPYRIWPYGGPWLYGQPFNPGYYTPDDTQSLADFCMRAKGYSLERPGPQKKPLPESY